MARKDNVLTTKDVAKRLKVSNRYAYDLMRVGAIKSFELDPTKIRITWRTTEKDLQDYIDYLKDREKQSERDTEIVKKTENKRIGGRKKTSDRFSKFELSQIYEMLVNGYTNRSIAKKMKCSETTICDFKFVRTYKWWYRDNNLEPVKKSKYFKNKNLVKPKHKIKQIKDKCFPQVINDDNMGSTIGVKELQSQSIESLLNQIIEIIRVLINKKGKNIN